MAGINRLGRGNAKPGTLRPADPNRFKTEDFFSVDAEHDAEYLRRIMEVEQLAQNKQGSVLAKGAFDKNDAFFMRDEAEKVRTQELERRDAELAQFSRVRNRIEQEAAMEPYDPGPVYKRPKVVKSQTPLQRKHARASQSAQLASAAPGPGATPETARPSSREGQNGTADAVADAGAASQAVKEGPGKAGLSNASGAGPSSKGLPGDEMAQIVSSSTVSGGQVVGGVPAGRGVGGTGGGRTSDTRDAPARVPGLGLQYDSEDDSSGDSGS